MITMMRRVVEGSAKPEAIVQELIHGLVKLERQWIGFDSSARDEIIAHYKEGQDTAAILRNLTSLKIYDYFKRYKKSIAKIPARVKEYLLEEVSEVFYLGAGGGEMGVKAQALDIDETDVLPRIESVFKSEYKTDLKEWTESISVLEQKGYAKDEIVGLLYQEPINSWPNLARRMRPKNK